MSHPNLDDPSLSQESQLEEQESNQDGQQQAPSTVSFSEQEVQRAIFASQEIARRAQEEAARLREENARYQAQFSRPPIQPEYNFDELNERAANGQFAQVTADVVKRETDRIQRDMLAAMQPLLKESAEGRKKAQVEQFVDRAIASYPHPEWLRGGKSDLIGYVMQQLGNADPSETAVTFIVNGAAGMVLAQNPNAITEFYKQRQNPQTPPAPTSNPSRKPIPPSIPTGRPAPSNGKLSESDKKLKALLDPNGQIPENEFDDIFLADGQVRTYDLDKIQPGAKI